jgi:hypothetical protein
MHVHVHVHLTQLFRRKLRITARRYPGNSGPRAIPGSIRHL